MHTLYLCAALLSLPLVCSAQGKLASKLREFEVATIKPQDPDAPGTVGIDIYPGGRVVSSGLSLRTLVTAAFGLSYWQVSGGDAWTQKDIYKVEAKPAENSGITNLRHTLFSIDDERLREMLQALLLDRFQLKFHYETRTEDVYMLTRSGKTLALRPTEIAANADPLAKRSVFGSIGYVAGKWSIFVTTMPQLARFASDYVLHAPVLDRTGLNGPFDYRQTVPDLEPNYSDPTDSFLRFMPELGLKLEKSKGPVDVLVIDFAAKPSAN